jgi:hypothetical protein
VELLNQLLQTAGIVAPGFVAMKLIYIFGAQRQRPQWEWTVWSVLVGLACNAVATWVLELRLRVAIGSDDVALLLNRFGFALLFAGLVILGWGFLKHSDEPFRRPVRSSSQQGGWFKKPDDIRVWLRRSLTDSAWDEVVDDAILHERWMEVITSGPDGETAYRGWLHAGGREDAKAEPWLYLRSVKHRKDPGGWTKLEGTHGMLIHRDQIKRIRVFEKAGAENAPEESDTALAETNEPDEAAEAAEGPH